MHITHCVKKQKGTFCCNPDVTVTQLCKHPLVLVIQGFRATAAQKRLCFPCFPSLPVSRCCHAFCCVVTLFCCFTELHFYVVVAVFGVGPPPLSATCETWEWSLPCAASEVLTRSRRIYLGQHVLHISTQPLTPKQSVCSLLLSIFAFSVPVIVPRECRAFPVPCGV